MRWIAASMVASILLMGCSQRIATCPAGTAPGGIAPSNEAPLKACTATRAAADGLIDDFEDADTQLTKLGGRDGHWFKSHDPNGSTIQPDPLKWSDGGAGSSKKAIHVTGQTSSANGAWGVLFGANFAGQGVYDASVYAGISFKAKIDGNSTTKVRFKVGDVNTHPDGGVCKSCWNHFGKDLSVTSDWQEYKVSFAEMTQEAGWGERHQAVTRGKLFSVNWSIGPGQPFDLWIDDLVFFECM